MYFDPNRQSNGYKVLLYKKKEEVNLEEMG